MGSLEDWKEARDVEDRPGANSAIATKEKILKALDCRRAGMTYEAIAKHLGYANGRVVYALIQKGLRYQIREGADQVRLIELDRLDMMQKKVFARAVGGDLPAVKTMLQIMERRAKYMGLDAPSKVDARVATVKLDATTLGSDVSQLSTEELETLQGLLAKVKPGKRVLEDEYTLEAEEVGDSNSVDGGGEGGISPQKAY